MTLTVSNVKRFILADHKVSRYIETNDGNEQTFEFLLYGTQEYRCKLELSHFDDCFSLCSLSINGYVQSCGGFGKLSELRSWFEYLVLNYEVGYV